MQSPTDSVCLDDYTCTLVKVRAKKLAKHPSFRHLDWEDIAQDLFAAIITRANKYDPQRGCWSTFVARVVESNVRSLLRRQTSQKRQPAAGNILVSLEQLGVPSSQLGDSPAHVETEQDLQRRIHAQRRSPVQNERLRAFVDSLPEELRTICRSLRVRSAASTAKRLGLSEAQLTKAIAEIQKRFFSGDTKQLRCRVARFRQTLRV